MSNLKKRIEKIEGRTTSVDALWAQIHQVGSQNPRFVEALRAAKEQAEHTASPDMAGFVDTATMLIRCWERICSEQPTKTT